MLVTLPASTVFVVWCAAVWERYEVIGIRTDLQGGEAVMLPHVMNYEWYMLKRRARLSTMAWGGDSTLPKVSLWIVDNRKRRLLSRVPKSGEQYQDGIIEYPDGSIGDARMRLRGNAFLHWGLEKKSWRVKTKKKKLWRGMRKFNVIAPESKALLEKHFGFVLARELDLLTPPTEIVSLFINGENRGVHTLVEQPSELLLRKLGRMPGDLFDGDLVEEDMVQGFPNRIFERPGMWKKMAYNNHYPEESSASVMRLCEILAWAPGELRGEALNSILDINSFGRFAAFRTLVQTGHMDTHHNWKMYYDPWRNRLEPFVWDPAAWNLAWSPTEERPAFEWPLFAKLDLALASDHRYRWAMHEAMHRFFERRADDKFLVEFDALAPEVCNVAKFDPVLSYLVFGGGQAFVQQGQNALRSRVVNNFDLFSSRHFEQPAKVVRGDLQKEAPGQWTLDVTLDGFRPIAGVHLNVMNKLSQEARFYWGYEKGGEMVEVSVPGKRVGSHILLDQPLLPGLTVSAPGTPGSFAFVSEPRALTYRLRIVLPDDQPFALRSLLSVDLKGETREIPKDEQHARRDIGNDSGVLSMRAVREVTRWSGTKSLEGLTEIHGDLHIDAGTLLKMAPGASVLVHGRLQAIGSEEAPIQIRPAAKAQDPWGTLAIRTPAASGSVLQFVHFVGGSGYKDDLQEYSGMFSAHDVSDLQVQNCRFEAGVLVDDMVHVVYGNHFEFEDCVFVSAASDALDLDACSGVIRNCRFEGSGNDAIDLMTSKVQVSQTVLIHSGDKGVSVGEGSELQWRGGRIESCSIGIEVKDDSLAWVRNALFVGNRESLHAYKKNWQYGNGGHGYAEGCDLRSSVSAVRAEKHSSWYLSHCKMPAGWELGKRVWTVTGRPEQLPEPLRRGL